MAKQVQQRFGGQRLVVGKLQTQLRHHAKGVGLDEQRGTEALLAEDLAAGELAGADDLQRTGGQLLLGAGGGGASRAAQAARGSRPHPRCPLAPEQQPGV
jgi:hypothetical protein